MIPKKLSRQTNHTPPKCQLYQPGFNDSNGCWLKGGWVTVPTEGFAKRAREHEALYKDIHASIKKQHYRNKGVSPKKMTPAQRQAWEYFSGEGRLDARYPNGDIGPVGITLTGGKPSDKSIKWLRTKGFKIIPLAKQPDGTVTDQREDIPPDLLSDDTKPIDVWKNVVKQNRDRARETALALADDGERIMGDFGLQMAAHFVVELEESIIQQEVRPDNLDTLDDLKARYIELRKEVETKLGDKFEAAYTASKSSHNHCARINLDNSKGHLFCWVLPKFNPDGTHEPIGPKDFPWAEYEYPVDQTKPEPVPPT